MMTHKDIGDVHYVDHGLPQDSYWAIELRKPDGEWGLHEVCEAKEAQDKKEVLGIYLDSIYEGNYRHMQRDRYLDQTFGDWWKERHEW